MDAQAAAAFSIMFVSVGFSCFIWQTIRTGYMFYKFRKPIIGAVFFQALLGAVVTFVTLLSSLVNVNCKFLLIFSIFGVNVADITLQAVLLWKAFLGNNRSKIILFIGMLPLLGIVVFIIANITVAQSSTQFSGNVCNTDYPTIIVIIKASLDFTSNIFLSMCFVLVIYRHYRVLGSSVQKTLIKEGLIYCFGVCISNIITGILLTLRVLGGSSPILYTIDWYLASYLIIKQLKYGRSCEVEEDEDVEDDGIDQTKTQSELYIKEQQQKEQQQQQTASRHYSDQFTMVDHSQPTLLEKPISMLLKQNNSGTMSSDDDDDSQDKKN